MTKVVIIDMPFGEESVRIGGDNPLVLIAGPCVIESYEKTLYTAERLKDITQELSMPLVFKSSYDKANRTSIHSPRGPGLREGLRILNEVKERAKIPILSDIHRFEEIDYASGILDVLQVPAFLCRQTDFVTEIARTGKVVNLKKGQFLAPWDMKSVVEKVESIGNKRMLLTERGVTFGYNNLVADMRSLPIMRRFGYPVVFDATHSLQLPGSGGTVSGGQREFVPYISRAAVGAGVDALFMEVHDEPDRALCDGPNSMCLEALPALLKQIRKIDDIVKENLKE